MPQSAPQDSISQAADPVEISEAPMPAADTTALSGGEAVPAAAAAPVAEGEPKHRVIDAGSAGAVNPETPWAKGAAAIAFTASLGLAAVGLKSRRQGRHTK